ncbi:MAG: alpha/beta hydrolase [Bacteroidales bacterium]|nr:alpha/beta hydrolase [Bacteroidales bacterium]
MSIAQISFSCSASDSINKNFEVPDKVVESDTVVKSFCIKNFVQINGANLGMFITGTDSTKPVLLFVHGGPGMPEYTISREHPLVLEKYFTVCWLEQRGAGMSYDKKMTKESLSFEILISDLIEVSKYLKSRFNQEKIYLMAHSGGSFSAMQLVAKAPEHFHAYLAVAQITNQQESEKLAFEYMTNEYRKRGDKKMLKEFSKYDINKLNNPKYYVMRDKPMHHLGIGTTHEMKSVITGVFFPVMKNKDYTFRERINIWRGKSFTTKTVGLWSELVLTDITQKVKKIEVPIYFFHGVYDYTVSYKLAKSYYEMLVAPEKAFYSFENSAHSPMFEESQKFGEIIENDILKLRSVNDEKQ